MKEELTNAVVECFKNKDIDTLVKIIKNSIINKAETLVDYLNVLEEQLDNLGRNINDAETYRLFKTLIKPLFEEEALNDYAFDKYELVLEMLNAEDRKEYATFLKKYLMRLFKFDFGKEQSFDKLINVTNKVVEILEKVVDGTYYFSLDELKDANDILFFLSLFAKATLINGLEWYERFTILLKKLNEVCNAKSLYDFINHTIVYGGIGDYNKMLFIKVLSCAAVNHFLMDAHVKAAKCINAYEKDIETYVKKGSKMWLDSFYNSPIKPEEADNILCVLCALQILDYDSKAISGLDIVFYYCAGIAGMINLDSMDFFTKGRAKPILESLPLDFQLKGNKTVQELLKKNYASYNNRYGMSKNSKFKEDFMSSVHNIDSRKFPNRDKKLYENTWSRIEVLFDKCK